MKSLNENELAALNAWMKAERMTQAEVAQKLQVTQSTVMRWLAGRGISKDKLTALQSLIWSFLAPTPPMPESTAVQSGKKLTIYLTGQSLAAIKRMGGGDNLSGAINRSLERLGELQRRVRLGHLFSEAEQNAIQDACMSWWAEPASTIAQGITLEVEDALEDGLADQWLIDGPHLVSKLKNLSYAEELSIVMWLEAKRTKT